MLPDPIRSAAAAPRQCGFVPPYLLRHLTAEEHPTVAAAEHPCGRTLRIDAEFRERRAEAAAAPPPTSARASAAAAEEVDRWVVYSADNSEVLPGREVRADGDPTSGDIGADEAYAWAQQVWDLYQQQFDRSSFDGRGSTVPVTVHYGQDYDNAFWDGDQLVFGDGDGQVFERFTKPADVLAHEFTHGVVQYTAGFTYQGQSGALNESVADVFASMSIQYAAGQTVDQATWLIGEGLFVPGINAIGLRSMLEPGTAYDDPRLGKDPQVGSMADYVDTTDDNGGVHLNSGIPNRAFALAATGVGGRSWEQTGRVWYEALTSDAVGASTDFAGFAAATVAAADRLFPDGVISGHVRDAWVTVGVLAGDTPPVDVVGPAPAGHPSSPAEPGAEEIPQKVAVRRTGGFAGQVRSAEIELGDEPEAVEVRRLLRRVDLRRVTTTHRSPDRFVYTVEVDHQSVTVSEADLPPDLQRVVQIVLGSADRPPTRPDPDLG